MNITNKTWHSGGVDIRSGSDSSGDVGQDSTISNGQYTGQTSSSGGYGWTTNNATNSQSTSATVQSFLSYIATGPRSSSLVPLQNKLCRSFSVRFIGFDSFNNISSSGYSNATVLDEQTAAVSSIGRTKTGWSSIAFAMKDDVGNDVLNIINEQFNAQTVNQETFDVVIEYYDDIGTPSATTYLYGCVIEEFSSDPLNAAYSGNTEMKVEVLIQPRAVTFS